MANTYKNKSELLNELQSIQELLLDLPTAPDVHRSITTCDLHSADSTSDSTTSKIDKPIQAEFCLELREDSVPYSSDPEYSFLEAKQQVDQLLARIIGSSVSQLKGASPIKNPFKNYKHSPALHHSTSDNPKLIEDLVTQLLPSLAQQLRNELSKYSTQDLKALLSHHLDNSAN